MQQLPIAISPIGKSKMVINNYYSAQLFLKEIRNGDVERNEMRKKCRLMVYWIITFLIVIAFAQFFVFIAYPCIDNKNVIIDFK